MIKEFINVIVNYNNIDEILDDYKLQSDKGIIFERLFDIIIKFGFCDKFKNFEYDHLIGNVNNGKLKILKDLNKIKINNGNSSGCSDITLQNNKDNTFIFISCKYPKTTEHVDYYDIQNIIAMATKNKNIYKNYKIYLIVPSKEEILKKINKANKSSEYITEHMLEENILDKNNLNKYFIKFKEDIIKNIDKDWNEIYLNKKEKLNLRFHQELISKKTNDLIINGEKLFLWGCKPRSGKTYIFAGIILKQYNVKKKLNVLIITPAPTETISQFTEDLFHKYKNFENFKIIYIKEDNIEINKEDNNILILSKQYIQQFTNENTLKIIKDLKLDIIGFDEAHYTGTTDISKKIIKSYESNNTVKIFLTATYNKPLIEWNIPFI